MAKTQEEVLTAAEMVDDSPLPAELIERVRSSLRSPWRFKPPSSKEKQPDRDPSAGLQHKLSIGGIGAGMGAFIVGSAFLGCKCKWYIESWDLAVEVAKKHIPSRAKRFATVELTHPLDVPEVDGIVAGPPCQSFSKAGKQRALMDQRSKAMLWIVWCLAVRQFKFAIIENVSHLQTMRGGDVWRSLTAMFHAAGYHLHHEHSCAARWLYPETRKRVFILALRADLFQAWGVPRPLVHPAAEGRRLASILEPPERVGHMFEAHDFFMREMMPGVRIRWTDDWQELVKKAKPGVPICVMRYGAGGYGQRVYANATPASKHFGEDPGGATHLIIQADAEGVWRARRLMDCEVKRKFDGVLFPVQHPVPAEHSQAASLLGNSCNMDMWIGVMGHYLSHLRPQ